MPRKLKLRRRRRFKPSKKPYGTPEYKKARYAMYRSPRTIMPQEYVTTLRFSAMQQISMNGVTINSTYFASSPYDVDPTLGNSAMAGFTQLAAFYARVRPLRMTYVYDIANMEDQPLCISTGFTSEILSGEDIDVSGNPLWKTAILGAKGGMDRKKFKGSASIVQIAGTKQALYDDLYTSSTVSNTLPTAGTNYAYLIATSIGAGTAAGFQYNVRFSLTCQFYRPKVFNP